MIMCIEKDTLYGLSMSLVFNSLISVRIPWYQTGLFKAVLLFGSAVITVISLGSLVPANAALYASLAVTYGRGAAYGRINNASWAESLLQVGSNLSEAAKSQFQSDIADIQQDIAELETLQKERQEELDEANELLENNTLLDLIAPSGFVSLLIPGESPEQFYSRTSTLNIPQLTYDYVNNYYERNLELPTIQESLIKIQSGEIII